MKVSLVQATPKLGDKEANINLIRKKINSIDSDLFIFGELFLTGYSYNKLSPEAIPGPSSKRIAKMAERAECSVIFGMAERSDKVYNTAVLASPDGELKWYRKWHLPHFGVFKEKKYFAPGHELPLCVIDKVKLGLLICYDIFFPELSKCYGINGATLLVCISASPIHTKPYFERVIQARAIENTCFFLYTNLVGKQGDLKFWGGSRVIDPKGMVKAKAKYYEPEVLTYNINSQEVNRARPQRPVLSDTRAELIPRSPVV